MSSVAPDNSPELTQYSKPELMVTTAWLAEHLDDPGLVVVESDEDVLLYDTGHIPGSRNGIGRDSTVVFYGDNFNWWAAYALWVFRLFGHSDVRLLNGGRMKWIQEGRELSTDVVKSEASDYPVVERDDLPIRAFRDDVLKHVNKGGKLVDVRSPGEYSGELLHMPDYPQEGALRGGHIPGAASKPWKNAANDDGTFKDADALRKIYADELGLSPDDDVVVYCRIGERSSHTWFVLQNLLGYPTVRNYDGSWTEWGNLVKAPIEK